MPTLTSEYQEVRGVKHFSDGFEVDASGYIRVRGTARFDKDISVYDGGYKRATLTTDGDLALGLDDPDGRIHTQTETAPQSIFHDTYAESTGGIEVAYRRARGTKSAPLALQSGDVILRIIGQCYDTAFSNSAEIRMVADAEHGTASDASDAPGRITLSTSPNGTQTLTEALRINSSQQVLVGNTAGTGRLVADQAIATGAIPALGLVQTDVSEEFIRLTGTSANGVLTQSLVRAADVATFTVVGYEKVYVTDDGNLITDGPYYRQFGTIAA